jgi:hypothetical protein
VCGGVRVCRCAGVPVCLYVYVWYVQECGCVGVWVCGCAGTCVVRMNTGSKQMKSTRILEWDNVRFVSVFRPEMNEFHRWYADDRRYIDDVHIWCVDQYTKWYVDSSTYLIHNSSTNVC